MGNKMFLLKAVEKKRKVCLEWILWTIFLVPVSWCQQMLKPPRREWERSVPLWPSRSATSEPLPAPLQDPTGWTPLRPCCWTTEGHRTGWTWTYQRRTRRSKSQEDSSLVFSYCSSVRSVSHQTMQIYSGRWICTSWSMHFKYFTVVIH